MIERFSIGVTASQLAERFEAEEPTSFLPRYNLCPAQLVPVITHQAPQGFSYFYWGQPPGWSKNKTLAERIINVRSESIGEKPTIRKNMMQSRCLIPSDGFYSWKKLGKKSLIPWRFVMKDKSLYSMPALWEEYDDEEGKSFHTFTLITTVANALISVANERMPIVFDKESEKKWLSKESNEDELMSLLISSPAERWDGFSVSTKLNDVTFDRPSLVLPMPPADQFGNLTLFD
jgi:putative SOS response-associated peptidase YedK